MDEKDATAKEPQGASQAELLKLLDSVYRSSDLSIFKSGYLIFDTVSVFEYSNHIFMMSISNRILSGMIDTIRI